MWPLVLSILAGLVLLWLALAIVLFVVKPDGSRLTETARIVPDTVRLLHRLARDRQLHRGIRIRLWLLLGYLVSPIDLIPDFVPVVGYADDAIMISVVLRSVVKRAGADAGTVPQRGRMRVSSKLAKLAIVFGFRCTRPAIHESAHDPTVTRDRHLRRIRGFH